MLPARDRVTVLKVYPSKADAIANTNGTSYSTGIVSGTARLERTFFSSLPAFGECNAAMFECELNINVDLKGKWIRVATQAYASESATSRTTYWLFCGLVDDCKYDTRQATRKLVAYDEMYTLRSIDVSTWWKDWWALQTGTVAVGTVLSAMMNEFGVSGTAAASLASYFGILAEKQADGLFGGGSFAQVLQYIGLVCGCSFYFDKAGKLTVCLYSNVNKTNTALAIDTNVDTVNSVFGDAAGETYGSAQINVGSATAYRYGSAEPTFVQSDNPLLSGYTATNYMTIVTQLCTIAQKMSGLKSAEIEMIVSTTDVLEYPKAISYGSDVFMASGIVLYGEQMINETITCTGEMSTAPMYVPAVTEENIVDGAVTADKIRVQDLAALNATIGGWTIDTNSIKKTYGANGGVWLNAPEYPSGQNSAFHAQDLYGENNLSLNYDGSLVSTCHLIGVGDDTVTVDDGEIYVEKKYYKQAGNPSSEWRRGETTISGATLEVLDSKRDNTETRDDPSFRGELSGYPEQAVVAVEANTTNGRTEIYASAQDQKAEFEADFSGNSIHGIVDGANAKVEVTDGTKLTRVFTGGVYTQNGLNESFFNPNEITAKTATGTSGNYTLSRARQSGQTFESQHRVYENGVQTEYYLSQHTAGSFSIYVNGGDVRARLNALGVHTYDSNGTEKSTLTNSALQVNAHNLLRMTPHLAQMFATSIPSGANLNTATYLACGQYFTASSAISGSLTNCPTASPFSMTVEAPNSATYDNESASGEAYRIRKMTVLGGEEWVQYCYKTSTTWTYGTWMQVSIGVSKDTYANTAMKAGNLIARRNGNVVYIVSTGNATSVAGGNWRTYVTIAAKYRPSEETFATVTNAYGEVKTARIRTNGNVDLYTGTTISSASNFAFTATYIVD